ncbi:MAG: iron ABC transporter permease [Clostridia bacterium]|nr:iron ABC transporter permease [Clostridia bacterium]
MLVLNVNIGSQRASIPVGRILEILLHGGPDGTNEANVIWTIRLPRLLAAAVLGGALSVSGFLLQSFFRNPIAGPYVLGISSGAKLMVGVMLVFVYRKITGVPFWTQMAASFVGSMLITAFVLLFAQRVKSMASLLVIGIMISSVCTAVTDFLITLADQADVVDLHAWSMGRFSAVSWTNLHIASAVIFAALAGAILLSKPISAYQLGESYAQSMGVPVRAFRVALIGLSSLLSAAVTALSGPISFVGVAVPHMTQLLFGSARPLVIIPGSFLLGGVFCMGCDLIVRVAFPGNAPLPISTVTAVFGAPVVIALMLRRQRGKADG